MANTPKFSGKNRSHLIESLEKEYFDIIVIGGGVTGAGIALDAASRGFKVALIEKGDFASGTSSKSTKLIHGGLRYLKNFEFSLVREVGKERAIVNKIAPHLVRPEKMLLPLIKDGNYGKIITSVGLMVYDVLADVESEDQRVMMSKKETLDLEPLLREDLVEGGGLYSEYQTDDFRLVIELIKASQNFGAKTLNYMKVEKFLYKGGKVCGVECRDAISDKVTEIHGDHVINATGPWVDQVRSNNEVISGKRLHLTKGVHIVVPHDRLPVKHAVYFDVSDGRMIFAIPKGNVTYIGTTDTDYEGDPKEALVSKEDMNYLLDAVNHMFPSLKLVQKDITSSWAGVRPLIGEDGKSTSEISRKDEVFEAETGLISIAGGKLTGYRKMAKKAVGIVVERIIEKVGDSNKKKCKTRKIMLPGAGFKNTKQVLAYKDKLGEEMTDIDPLQIEYLVDLYGNQVEEIRRIAQDFSDEDPEIGLFRAELRFSMEHEMTLRPTDFYVRRTGRLFYSIESIAKTKDLMISDMADYLQWSEDYKEKEIIALDAAVTKSTTFA